MEMVHWGEKQSRYPGGLLSHHVPYRLLPVAHWSMLMMLLRRGLLILGVQLPQGPPGNLRVHSVTEQTWGGVNNILLPNGPSLVLWGSPTPYKVHLACHQGTTSLNARDW